MNPGLYSSNDETWGTPQEFFDHLDQEFHFDVDVCALPHNAKCATYFTPEIDGLKQEWAGTCWMNPVYGTEIIHWMKKAYESSQKGATVVCLVPARTDTQWWHHYAMKASEIRLVKGRLKFTVPSGRGGTAPFPSAVVIFRPEPTPLRVVPMERVA